MTQKQTTFIPLVSNYAIKNASKPLDRVYPDAPISEIVQKILSDPTLLVPTLLVPTLSDPNFVGVVKLPKIFFANTLSDASWAKATLKRAEIQNIFKKRNPFNIIIGRQSSSNIKV